MHRFVLKTGAGVGGVVVLDEGDSHHAARVLRMAEGEALEILDGSGRCLRGRVVEVSKRATRVEVEHVENRPAPPRVRLAPSLIKGKAMDFLVQKATELGVACLSPLVTERAVVRVTADEAESRVADWTRTAVEACKQCGNPWLPCIEPPSTLLAFLERHLFEIDLLTSLEPETPGGETPPSTAGGTPAATEDRFMGRRVFQKLDTHWAPEPRTPGGETPPSTAGGTPAAAEARYMGRRGAGLLLVASLRGDARPVRAALGGDFAPVDGVTLVLGPEGDFTRDEEEALRAAGAQPISLGPLVLRSETAAIAGLAVIQYELSLSRGS